VGDLDSPLALPLDNIQYQVFFIYPWMLGEMDLEDLDIATSSLFCFLVPGSIPFVDPPPIIVACAWSQGFFRI
jgi:hypothetical protein